MNFEQIKEINNSSAMPTYGRYDLGIASGKGAIATDFDGKEYIDFTSVMRTKVGQMLFQLRLTSSAISATSTIPMQLHSLLRNLQKLPDFQKHSSATPVQRLTSVLSKLHVNTASTNTAKADTK